MHPLSGITRMDDEEVEEIVCGVDTPFLFKAELKFTIGMLKKVLSMSPHPQAFPPVEASRDAIIAFVCTSEAFIKLQLDP